MTNKLPIDPRHKNVLIVFTPYVLFLYLLSQEFEDIENTKYIFRYGMMPQRDYKVKDFLWYRDIGEGIDYGQLREKYGVLAKLHLAYAFYKQKQILKHYIKPFLPDKYYNYFTHIAPDASTIPNILSGAPFIHIEDGTRSMAEDAFDFSKRGTGGGLLFRMITPKIKKTQLIGRIWVYGMGDNAPEVSNVRLDIQEAWANSSEKKRQRILEIFNISPDDIALLQGRDSVLLMQGFTPDGFFSWKDEEQELDLYRRAILDAGEDKILLKRHPRDRRKDLADRLQAPISDSVAPMELFSLSGVKIKRVYAVSSTAVFNIPQGVEICLIDQGSNNLQQELLIQELERQKRPYRMI